MYITNLQQAYNAVQGSDKGEIYQSAQNEELEPAAAGNTGALHHQLFQVHWQHRRGPGNESMLSNTSLEALKHKIAHIKYWSFMIYSPHTNISTWKGVKYAPQKKFLCTDNLAHSSSLDSVTSNKICSHDFIKMSMQDALTNEWIHESIFVRTDLFTFKERR